MVAETSGIRRRAAASRPATARAHRVATPAAELHSVLRLQQSIGNSAAAAYLSDQRRGTATLQRTIGDGHDLSNHRFALVARLEAIFDGESTLGMGDHGTPVRIIQQALIDAGYPIATGVSGAFDASTRGAVRAFQTALGLGAAHQTGRVGRVTMGLLDTRFASHAPDRANAMDTTRAPLDGTRTLTAAEKAAFRRAITTEQRAPGGALPTFHRIIGSTPTPYEDRIRAALNSSITALHTSLVTSRPARVAANLMQAPEINAIGNRAKAVTDLVFGRYKTGPALAFGLNIRDQFEVRDAEIAASAAAADAAAAWRVDKLLQGEDVIKDIDREHGAVQSRAAEAALVGPVRSSVIAARRAELLAIHRNWPASAGGGEINLQRYRGTTAASSRDNAWDLFSTVIHEYIHTLEHPNHEAFRSGLAEQRGGFVLREGATDYFAKVVWDGLTFDAALRSAVEGASHDPAHPTAHPIPQPARYDEWVNAERGVGIVGIRNLMAAFFRGRTDLIS